ncbi:MAG: DDE-type integrase/transposase/recombinase [Xanthomonadales bacterium]|nr:DDE-type integrase/transposase/recombinase [Xanthomonadales bacterium]
MAPRIRPIDAVRLSILQPLMLKLEDDGSHGSRGALVRDAANKLSCSPQAVWQDLKSLGYASDRKQRNDAGRSAVPDKEVMKVAGIISAAYRDNDKRLMSIGAAMQKARANGLLTVACSERTMARRMMQLKVHFRQVERPSAHVRLRSNHPNHVWEIDPSLCVLYRLPDGRVGVMRADDELIYKNKLENLEILHRSKKLWRYVQWDHASSAIFVRYFETPGESTEVLFDFLVEATSKRDRFLMHGWPSLIYWDKGSANRSAPIKNMFSHLGVRHETHKARAARAKGGVENANNLVECQFESGLAFMGVPTIEELNRLVDDWQIDLNSMAICSRHGHTRYGAWQMIRSEQLLIGPPAEELRMLLNSAPVERKITGDLCVSFGGLRYSVEHIADLSAGDQVRVSTNAHRKPNVWVIAKDRGGIERYTECTPMQKDQFGFYEGAATIGEEYKPHVERPVDVARKDLREMAFGTRDENEAIAARKRGRVAFDGAIDPYKHIADRKSQLPQFMQRRGTEMDVPTPVQIELKPLDHVAALKALASILRRRITPEENALVAQLFPAGVPEDEINALAERINAPASVSTTTRHLRAVS